MEDKFFDIDEMMVDYAEMTSFDFSGGNFLANDVAGSEMFGLKKESGDFFEGLKSMFTQLNLKTFISK